MAGCEPCAGGLPRAACALLDNRLSHRMRRAERCVQLFANTSRRASRRFIRNYGGVQIFISLFKKPSSERRRVSTPIRHPHRFISKRFPAFCKLARAAPPCLLLVIPFAFRFFDVRREDSSNVNSCRSAVDVRALPFSTNAFVETLKEIIENYNADRRTRVESSDSALRKLRVAVTRYTKYI